jgi:hypothetical protein
MGFRPLKALRNRFVNTGCRAPLGAAKSQAGTTQKTGIVAVTPSNT